MAWTVRPMTHKPSLRKCGYLLAHINAPQRGPGPSPCDLPEGHDGWHQYAPLDPMQHSDRLGNTERPPLADVQVADARDTASGGRSALAGDAPDEGGTTVPQEAIEATVNSIKNTLPAGVFMTDDHRYYFNGEGPVPSVTTILEVLSKPALVTWKAQETAKALIRYFSGDNIEHAEKTNEELVRWAIQQTDQTRDKAAGIGTSVHLLADLISRQDGVAASETPLKAFQVSEQEKPYAEAFAGFLAFLQAQGGRIVSSEHAVWSLNGYAGTYDLIVELPGPWPDMDVPQPVELWLIDIKTSKGYYPEYGLQLAGYRWADWIILEGDPRTYPMPEIHRTGILHLRPDQYESGWRLIEYPTDYQRDYMTFLGALEIHKWRKEGRFQKQKLQPLLNTVLST